MTHFDELRLRDLAVKAARKAIRNGRTPGEMVRTTQVERRSLETYHDARRLGFVGSGTDWQNYVARAVGEERARRAKR